MTPRAYRLPRSVWPVEYSIEIDTHPARAAFSGRVRIDLDVREHTARIELHARDLVLIDPRLEQGDEVIALLIKPYPESEHVVFELERSLAKGAATFSIGFKGRPSTSMHGLYIAQDGKDRAVCTQCEATDARAIFPCFDEPEFKARFRWTIRTGREVIALANGPLSHVEASGSQRTWEFAPTSKISSYLVALAVGDFESSDESIVGGVKLRVFGLRGKKSQALFAHRFTEKILPWCETYFDQPYPFLKYDQVAVPGFDAGAMENVGLVLYRQNLLLLDPRSASWHQEKLVAKVVAHELAHMWFGNLVTMAWWDDLWLNEAFAEWFAHKVTHAIDPSYQVWNDFQGDKNRALVDDALPTTHAIWAEVETPAQALEMFDVITYQKGCAVMRMLESFIGDNAFCRGIRSYMKAFSGGNARGDHLWQHLAVASEQPVGELMRSWIEQPGFPLLSFRVDEGESDGDLGGSSAEAELVLRQRRFFSSPKAASEPNDQLWNIPVVLRYRDAEGEKTHRVIFGTREARVKLPSVGRIEWCCANQSDIGFYRQEPDAAARAAMACHGPRVLTPVEQMGFIEDQWSLVRNARSTIEAFFPVLEAFSASEDHNVLRAVSDRLTSLNQLLEDSRDEKAVFAFRGRVSAMFEPQLALLGLEPRADEAQNERQRRAIATHALGSTAERSDVIEACARAAAREREDACAVDANLAGVFLQVAAKFGDSSRYDAWIDTYRDRVGRAAPPQECLRYLHTLSAFRPSELVRRTLQHVEDGTIPQESMGSVLSQLLATRHGQVLAWEHVKLRWGSLSQRIGDMAVSRVVESVGALLPEHRQDVVEFFAANPPRGAERALGRALERIDQMAELSLRITPSLIRIMTSSS